MTTTNSEDKSSQTAMQEFALVTLKGSLEPARKIPLPFSVGSCGACTIIIQDESLLPLASIIGLKNGELVSYDLKNSEYTRAHIYEGYGLKISGPINQANQNPNTEALTWGAKMLKKTKSAFNRNYKKIQEWAELPLIF